MPGAFQPGSLIAPSKGREPIDTPSMVASRRGVFFFRDLDLSVKGVRAERRQVSLETVIGCRAESARASNSSLLGEKTICRVTMS